MTTQATFTLRGRNPDVLTCIANLSNDEVFTPPELAKRMLDTLAEAWAADNGGADIWADRSVKFLDPCTKSGVFLREIATRLIRGLADDIPDLEERVNHILTKQVFGIATTHLTSLLARRSVYCSKHALGEHSVVQGVTSDAGNIWFERTEHSWVAGRCKYCGAGRGTLDRGESLESYAYAFIHTHDIGARLAEMFGGDMRFDVIIGNPPYQLASDGGTRDIPIYQHFVEQAKRLEPRYLVMIIPSRWMAAGLGLSQFRQAMLADRRLRVLVDYPVAKEVFSAVEVKGGVCYFLWDTEHSGLCQVTMIRAGVPIGPVERDLNEYDVFVRDVRAVSILHKVRAKDEAAINTILSSDKEFGWTSNFEGFHAVKRPGDVPLYYVRKAKRLIGYIARSDVPKSRQLIDTAKVLVPKAGSGAGSVPDYVLSTPLVVSSPSVCTQTFLFFHVDTVEEAHYLRAYIATKFFRFLVSLRKITQDATRSTYDWVPLQSWDRIWTDEMLDEKYGIVADEREFIESMIRPMIEDDGHR